MKWAAMQSDSELVDDWRNGNEAALEILLRRYGGRIYGYLLRMLGNRSEAEDVAQEVFIRAVRGMRRYREQGNFKAWLFRIAYREGLRAVKRRKRRREREEAVEELLYAGRVDHAHEEELRRLEKAIAALPDAERQVVLLHIRNELGFKDVARITRTPLNTVLSRMHRAKQRLRSIMKREDNEIRGR